MRFSKVFHRLKKTTKVLTAIALMILAIELTLKAVGLIIIGGEIKVAEKIDSQSIRVLALGESTTDNRYAPNKKAWPEHLQDLAGQSNLKVKVYNHGRSAVTTNEILNDINELLDHYKPHIVITMMGINDTSAWILETSQSRFRGIKIYRILTWLSHKVSSIFAYRPLPAIGFNSEANDVENFDSKTKAQYYAFLADNILPEIPLPSADPERETKYKTALELYRKSLTDDHFVEGVLSQYLWLLIRAEHFDECSNVIKSYLNRGAILNFSELMNAQGCLNEVADNLEYLRSNHENISFTLSRTKAPENYKQIHKKIISSGSTHIIMQYPTLPIEIIKQHFKGSSKLYYVENKKNFENALKTRNKNEIFTDNFAGNFGHTTEYGSKLIANKIMLQLPDIISSLDR